MMTTENRGGEKGYGGETGAKANLGTTTKPTTVKQESVRINATKLLGNVMA